MRKDKPSKDNEAKIEEKSESEEPLGTDGEVSDASSEKKVKLKWWPILSVGFASLFLMLLTYVIGVKSLGVNEYEALIEWLRDRTGAGLAMFIYEFVCDSLIVPISPDLIWMIGANFKWWESVLIVGTASTLGGFAAYGLGVLLNKIPFIKKLTVKIAGKWGAYIKVYGVPFLIMSAILPLPFSTIVTICGVMRLGAKKSLPPCLLRYVHALIYYLLFNAGLLLI